MKTLTLPPFEIREGETIAFYEFGADTVVSVELIDASGGSALGYFDPAIYSAVKDPEAYLRRFLVDLREKASQRVVDE